MEKFKVKLSIVVVTMNHYAKVKNLLQSLYGDGMPDCEFEVILVDNCSRDKTISYVRKHYTDVIIHENKTVRGFAANNNYGVYLSRGEYIFICNPDVIILPNALNTLIEVYENTSNVGILCPQLLNSDLTHQASVRRFHSLKTLALRALTLGNDVSKSKTVRRYLMHNFNKKVIQYVNWALGAAMIIRRDVYEELSGFDEKFFLYVEDVDLCLRAWVAGYPVIYNPEAQMIHDHQRESSKGLNKKMWMHLRSMFYFFRKHNLFITSYEPALPVNNYSLKATLSSHVNESSFA